LIKVLLIAIGAIELVVVSISILAMGGAFLKLKGVERGVIEVFVIRSKVMGFLVVRLNCLITPKKIRFLVMFVNLLNKNVNFKTYRNKGRFMKHKMFSWIL